MSYLSDDAALIRRYLDRTAQPPPESDGLFLLYAVLMRAKGEQVTASDVHDAWTAWTLTRDPGHPALLPFVELSPEIRALDLPYMRAIHSAARQRAQDG
ncbi:hypothetical protein [Microbispora sp. NPDC049633]|uniref:DUF7701 domain-containing protein n=1 Tax=Microbispora sp. NPDC049633 TaxID=3154355 RepID=UPI0034336650